MSAIQNVEQLLLPSGSEFIDAAYTALLGRVPDPVGKAYYLQKLSRGSSKSAVIHQLATSKESRGFAPKIIGLDALMAEQKRVKHWFWGALHRSSRIERQTSKLENELGVMSQNLVKLQNESSERLSRLEGRLAHVTTGSTGGAPRDARLGEGSDPWIDASALSQPARQIYRRLTQASSLGKNA